MGGQLVVLGLFSTRIPLAAKFPEPIENTSLIAIVCTQLILAAALAPKLLADRQSFGSAVAGAIPMTLLATLLSGQPASHAIVPLALTVLWLGVFAVLGQIRDLAIRTTTQTLLLLLTAGAPVLLYLCWEFGIRPVAANGLLAILSPTLGAASLCLPGTVNWWVFAGPSAVLLAFGVGMTMTKARVIATADKKNLQG